MQQARSGDVPCFELKGGMFTLTVLRLLQADMDAVAAQLGERRAQAPALFQHLPVVIDLEAVRELLQPVDLARLVLLLNDNGLVPVAVRNASAAHAESAREFGLALFSEPRRARAAPAAAKPPAPGAGRLVSRPVRSGQQIYAQGGDLVVLGKVSAGAELLADGHIHVYGALCGRALAGVQGDEKARIFCQALHAELVSVAGQYRVLEDIEPGARGRPAQVWLDQRRLKIETV